jgi:hypothetical protein
MMLTQAATSRMILVQHVKLLAAYNHEEGFERYSAAVSARLKELFPFATVEVLKAWDKAGFYLLLNDEAYRAEAAASIQKLLQGLRNESCCAKCRGTQKPN